MGKSPEISIVITSFREPKTIGKAIESFVEQEIGVAYELYVAAPDEETLAIARNLQKKYAQIKIFVDPGKGKSYALNQLIPKLKGQILIFSDGDVFVSSNSIEEILRAFKDNQVGCVTGRPISISPRNTLFGYWSHLLCDAGAHIARLNRAKKSEFLECSGYLWAFRNNILNKFPLDVAEDTIVPFLFAEKGYKIVYAPKAEVYVKYPDNLHDFIEQKKRTAKGHENIKKYVDVKKIPKTKSFKNEVLEGYRVFLYPKSVKELLWTIFLLPIRLYIWFLVWFHQYIRKNKYVDGWKRVESTK